MRKSYVLAAFGACVIGGVLLLHHSLAWGEQPAQPSPVRVAICDVQKVFASYNRAADLLAKLNDKRQALVAEFEQRGKAIDALQQEMDALKKDSKEYQSRQGEVERLRIDRTVGRQFGEAEVLREHRRLTIEMYDQILAAVAQVAKERGYDIVLYRDHGLVDTEENMELLAQIGGRKLLYASDGLDITDGVLARLNEGYAASARKP